MAIQKSLWVEDLNERIRQMKKQFPDKPFWQFLQDGKEVLPVYRYEVSVGDIKASFGELGAALMSLVVKDRNGQERDVVLALEKPEAYLCNWAAFGAVIGRCTNRIKGAAFKLNGNTCQLTENVEGGCLHSGYGYHFRKWDSESYEDTTGAHMIFRLVSEDGDQGFPGRLQTEVEYLVAKDCSITLYYRYSANQDTIVNLTNHSYFNLSGHDSGTVLDHRLQIAAEYVTAVDGKLFPTGELLPVEGTAFDFREMSVIRQNCQKPFVPISDQKEYDINYVLQEKAGQFKQAAVLYSEESGIGMKVYTDMPGMQFYTANALHGTKGKQGAIYDDYPAVCFETQFYPDAVNIPGFETPLLRAGEQKCLKTCFRFFRGNSSTEATTAL